MKIRSTKQSSAKHPYTDIGELYTNAVFVNRHTHIHILTLVVLLQWPSHVVRKTSLELLHLLTHSTATRCTRTSSTLSDNVKLGCPSCQSSLYMYLYMNMYVCDTVENLKLGLSLW